MLHSCIEEAYWCSKRKILEAAVKRNQLPVLDEKPKNKLLKKGRDIGLSDALKRVLAAAELNSTSSASSRA